MGSPCSFDPAETVLIFEESDDSCRQSRKHQCNRELDEGDVDGQRPMIWLMFEVTLYSLDDSYFFVCKT